MYLKHPHHINRGEPRAQVKNVLGNIKQFFLGGREIRMVRQQMQQPDEHHIHILHPFHYWVLKLTGVNSAGKGAPGVDLFKTPLTYDIA